MNPRTLLVFAIILLTGAACGSSATIPPTPTPIAPLPETVVIAAGPASAPAMLPLELAATLRYFDAEGIKVVVHNGADGAQVAALLSGAAQFAAGSLEAPIKLQSQSKRLTMIASLSHLPGIAVLVRADLHGRIEAPADLKGRRIGVSAIGADTHVLFNLLASNAGLKAEDYTVVPVGTSTLQTALEQQQVEIGVGTDPFVTPILQKGSAVAMVDLRKQFDSDKYLIGEYQAAGIIADEALLTNHPQAAQHIVNAIMRAMAYLKSHIATELADLLPDDVTGKDKQAWIDAYTASKEIYSFDGRVTQPAVENAVEAYRRFNLINPAAKIDVARLYDGAFVAGSR